MSAALRYTVSAVFAASALAKAADFEATVLLFTGFVGGWESGVEVALVVLVAGELLMAGAIALQWGRPRYLYGGTIAVLSVFLIASGILVYTGAANCGCFGTLLPTGPAWTFAKNAILIGAVLFLYQKTRTPGLAGPAGSQEE